MRWKNSNRTESIWYGCGKGLPRPQGRALPRHTAGAAGSHTGHPTAPAQRWESRATSTPRGEGGPRCSRRHVAAAPKPRDGHTAVPLPDPADRTPSRCSCPSPGGQEGLPRSPGSRVPAAHGPVVLPGPSPGAVWRGLHKKGLSGARGRPRHGSQTCSGLDFPARRPKSRYGQLVGWAAGRREENTRDRGAAGRQP